MLFVSKTVTDRTISGKFWTPWILRSTPLRLMKNLELSEFRLPSSILAEIENVIHLKNCDRVISGKLWDLLGTKDYSFKVSE